MPRLKLISGFALLSILACGGGSSGSNFVVEPSTPVVGVGEQLRLAARPSVDLAGDIQWEVQEMYGGGLLQSEGPLVTYVAPDSAGTYHLILRATRADGRTLKQTLAVQVAASGTIEPGNPRVTPGASLAFTAHLRGLDSGAVRWSVQEADGGSIAEDGRYTAPARPGSYHVLATSAADPGVTAAATVTVSN